ncbi:PglZ domain-containing protein [bacterium]|nr:PglZ domain-containing protein [FCB group bacterium]MBL7192320.1 PglZ domain-containing protein [bacterium]
MSGKRILWVDDEIELLKSHIIYLGNRGYEVIPVTNGDDAIELVKRENFDAVLLDEMMVGRDGLSTLVELKEIRPDLPAVMITKNEEERLMEMAIGSKIDDYLTKPVNPSQILSALKKIFDSKKLSEAKLTQDYISEFNRINQLALEADWKQWIDIHLRLSNWEVELDSHPDMGILQSLENQRDSCNIEFNKYVEEDYTHWLSSDDRPALSTDVVNKYVFPHLSAGRNVLFIVIDCLRLDQWLPIEELLKEYYLINRNYYYSILPTATPYARNALFSGLFPSDIQKHFTEIWQRGEDDESSSNRFERQLMDFQLERYGLKLKPKPKYVKVLDPEEAANVERKVSSYFNLPLVSMVFNFIDILAHSRSSSEVLKEMVPNEAAYRSVVKSWFEHSALYSILRTFAKQDTVIIITSDHGSVRVKRGAKVISDKEASTNLRYKYGRNLKCDPKQAVIINDSSLFKLPDRGLNTNYLIAKENYYFVYPTNYHKYLALFRDSFFHGGISMEEMILPIVTMTAK